MSDTDATFNFLISMVYTQLFNLLCEKADDVYGGRLPVHVRCLIDECANIGQIPNLEKLVATIRSREISACLVLQAKSQLKAIYKDNADTIVGNMDSQIFLGGTEKTTLKDLTEILGKETIDMYTTGNTKGSQESYNMNYQKVGKELMSMDELAVMDGSKCIVQVRGVRPFPSGSKTWHQSTVAGIIRNEKYVGDLLQGKTFTVDPIAHRRLENLGESDKYLMKNHHEAIIEREVFDTAQEILVKRSKCHSNARLRKDEYRTLYTNKYAFSCKCRCGYCGATLTRRTWHSSKYKKIVWQCVSATKKGKKSCPNCKAITEEALMGAFVESYQIMTRDHKDVLDEFLERVEATLSESDVNKRIKKEKAKLKDITCKLNNLLDMHLEGKIDFATFEEKRDV